MQLPRQQRVAPRSKISMMIMRPPQHGRDATSRHDHVDMRMVGERRAPGVQNRCDAYAGAQLLGITCNRFNDPERPGIGRQLRSRMHRVAG